MRQLWDATPGRLSEAIGAGRGPALHKNLRECVAKAGQLKLLIASNLLPRGVGERKLRLLYAKEADARRWRQEDMADVAGWSAETLSELFKTLPAALAWPSEQFGVGASFGASATSLLPASASSLLPAIFVPTDGRWSLPSRRRRRFWLLLMLLMQTLQHQGK